VLNSRFLDNRAVGTGANPAQTGTPGGGSGGAIYNDGDAMTLSIGGSLFVGNHANEGGGAIFFVSDDRTGTMTITGSTLKRNPNAGFHTAGLPGIFFLGAQTPTITSSALR
jgi:predicted outer membrane repeat protein